jgi:hypothetical protein
MLNKILIGFLVVLLIPIIGFDKPKITDEKCYDCDTLLWQKAEIYLDSLKNCNEKHIKQTYKKVDSLEVEIFVKDKKIVSLKKEVSKKPKEIIIKDTVFLDRNIETKKNFWGKTKTDTINGSVNN